MNPERGNAVMSNYAKYMSRGFEILEQSKKEGRDLTPEEYWMVAVAWPTPAARRLRGPASDPKRPRL
jgi:hypothetical protein